MSQDRWSEVDSYIVQRLLPADPILDAVLDANAAAGLPPADVSPAQGKLLYLFARMVGARRVLEIGTLGGYSTIWLARALPADGVVVTLEVVPEHAAVARLNLERAGLAVRVDLRVGPALQTLQRIDSENRGPFDLIFIDADKPSNPDYLAWALRLARPGNVIVDPASRDPRVQGVRRFFDMMASEPRLTATAIQTVGSKGWDGFAIAVVDRV